MASLRQGRTARTVLLRMAADQDRAERIGKLKRDRPDLTWRAIADQVGISERAAIDWAKTGGIAYDNAKKLAEVFDVDVDYIMRGDPSAPNLFGASQLDRVEAKLDYLIDALGLTQPDEEDAPARFAQTFRDAAVRAHARREEQARQPEVDARASQKRRATR